MIKRRARLGGIASAVGMGALIVGFVLSWQMSGPRDSIQWPLVAGSYAVLLVALAAFVVGRYHLARWSRRPRADEVLAESLSNETDKTTPGLDNHHYLFNYLPNVPADHLLITPRGLLVIVAKHILGEFRNEGARWHRKFSLGIVFGNYSEGSLGNPTRDALKAKQAVEERLRAGLGEQAALFPVSAAIVFTDRSAKVVGLEQPVVPVVAPRDLRDFVRTLKPEAKLPKEQIDRVADLFAPDRAVYIAETAAQAKGRGKSAKGDKSRLGRSAKPAQQRKRPKFDSPATDMTKMGRNREERRMYSKKK